MKNKDKRKIAELLNGGSDESRKAIRLILELDRREHVGWERIRDALKTLLLAQGNVDE